MKPRLTPRILLKPRNATKLKPDPTTNPAHSDGNEGKEPKWVELKGYVTDKDPRRTTAR